MIGGLLQGRKKGDGGTKEKKVRTVESSRLSFLVDPIDVSPVNRSSAKSARARLVQGVTSQIDWQLYTSLVRHSLSNYLWCIKQVPV